MQSKLLTSSLFIILFYILSFVKVVFAQTPIYEYAFGSNGKAEFAYDIIETPDGGFLMTGITMNNPNPTNSLDGKIKKVDANGNLLWENVYTGIQSTNDFLGSIIPKGNHYVVAGNTYGFSPLPPWYLKKQFWLIEISGSGTLIQQKKYGGIDDESAEKIIATPDSGFLIIGSTRSYDTLTASDVWLLKTNNNLDSLWSVRYDLGGEDAGVDIMPFNDKYIILANSCVENCNTPVGGLGFYKSNAYYLLVDSLGNMDTVYNISPGLKNHFKSITPTSDGGAVIAGSSDAVAQNYAPDLWVLKLNANLNTMWTRTYGDSGTYDGCRGIFQQADGNYIAGGYSQSFVIPGVRDFDCPWVIKLDQNGDSIWSFVSGTEDNDGIMQIIPASDGSIIATGYYGLDSKPESLFDLDLGPGKFYLLKLTDTLLTNINNEIAKDNFIKIYPNPFSISTTIEFDPIVKNADVYIFSSIGQLMQKHNNFSGSHYTLYRKGLKPGMYYLKIVAQDKIFIERILIN